MPRGVQKLKEARTFLRRESVRAHLRRDSRLVERLVDDVLRVLRVDHLRELATRRAHARHAWNEREFRLCAPVSKCAC